MRSAAILIPALVIPCFLLGLGSCTTSTRHAPPPEVTTFDDETRARLDADLADARRTWEADPTDEMATIWLGRRLAYLGRYDEAIETFTEGLRHHPESYRLLRHRGHRFITTRRFDDAIDDLERARSLIEGIPDATEPDGAPNEQGIPLTTTHSNIHYHLALAYHLQGRFGEALAIHEAGAPFADTNDDQRVSRAYWRYRALRELGRDDEARAILDEVLHPDLTIIENHAYLACLEAYRSGDLDQAHQSDAPILGATYAYGIGAEHLANGDRTRAIEGFRDITNRKAAWPAFGFIAAEAALERLD